MRLRKMIYWLVPAGVLVMLFTGLQGIFSTGPQIDTTYACNPCDCPHDARINCQGVQLYAVYTRDTDGDNVCNIDVYRLIEDTEEGQFAFSVTVNQLAGLPPVAQDTLVATAYDISMFKRPTGDFQVNAGPDREGKVFTVRFQGCPAQNVRENSFIGDPPSVAGVPSFNLFGPPTTVDAPAAAPATGNSVAQNTTPSVPSNAGVSAPAHSPAPVSTPVLPPGFGLTPN